MWDWSGRVPSEGALGTWVEVSALVWGSGTAGHPLAGTDMCAGKGRGFLPRWERVQTWGRRWCHPATLSVAELLQLYGAESNSNASTRHCSSVTSEAGGNVGNFSPICRSKFITSLVRRPRSTASVIVFSLLRWCGWFPSDLKQQAGRACFKYTVLISFCVFSSWNFSWLTAVRTPQFANMTFTEKKKSFFASK